MELINETLLILNELKRPLELISSESESRFIELGNELQSMYSEAEDLTRMTVETANLTGRRSDENKFPEVEEYARGSMVRLDECKERVSGLLAKFETCLASSKRLNAMCPNINKIAKTLNILALNISMESGRQDLTNDTFRIFVNEIKGLAQKIKDIADRMEQDSEMIRLDEKNDIELLLERRDQMSHVAEETGDIVSQNIDRIEGFLSRSFSVLLNSENHSNRISGLIGDVVTAIQFHDITKQQIEHVIDAILDIVTLMDQTNIDADKHENRARCFTKVHSIINLQVSQLRQVESEIAEAHRKINRAFEEIDREIDALLEEMFFIEGGALDKDRHEDQFNMLIAGLEGLETVLAQGKGLARDINGIIKEASVSAARISDYLPLMEDISMELHIKAINALIMSNQLGKSGLTLGVLAEDVREVSGESYKFVSDIVEILKSLCAIAKELDCVSSKDMDEAFNESIEDNILGNRIKDISNTYGRFVENMRSFIERSARLKENLRDVMNNLSFMDEMIQRINDSLAGMKCLLTRVGHLSSDKVARITELEKLKERYTMQVERGIHLKTIDSSEMGLSGNDHHKLNNKDCDLGENVKLF